MSAPEKVLTWYDTDIDLDLDLAVKKQDPKEDKLLSLFRSVTDSEKELLIKVVDTFVLGLRKARQQTN